MFYFLPMQQVQFNLLIYSTVASCTKYQAVFFLTLIAQKKVVSVMSLERPIRPALISGFRSVKRLGVFLLPPGWDASPSQGYPQHFRQYPFIHLGGERHSESKVSCPRTQHNVPAQVYLCISSLRWIPGNPDMVHKLRGPRPHALALFFNLS